MKKRLLCIVLSMLLIGLTLDASAYFSFMPTREYDGVTYEARSDNSITTMLLIGYDHRDFGEMETILADYTEGGQSDFLLLLVFDHDNQQIRQLQLNRDTITPIRVYSRDGKVTGLRNDLQLCLSHAFGNTQELNNQNAIWAVENLLGIQDENDGAEIDWYISMDISGISKLNDLMGGVTVPINHDFSYFDKTMVPGTVMTLQGYQAEIYCRHRYYIGDSSNLCRMERQRTYMAAAAKQLREKVSADVNFASYLLNGMGITFDTTKNVDAGFGFTTSDNNGTPITDTPDHYLMTNSSLDGLVSMVAKVMDYEIMPTEVLPGVSRKGETYMEHILEEAAGLKWALDALYNPVE